MSTRSGERGRARERRERVARIAAGDVGRLDRVADDARRRAGEVEAGRDLGERLHPRGLQAVQEVRVGLGGARRRVGLRPRVGAEHLEPGLLADLLHREEDAAAHPARDLEAVGLLELHDHVHRQAAVGGCVGQRDADLGVRGVVVDVLHRRGHGRHVRAPAGGRPAAAGLGGLGGLLGRRGGRGRGGGCRLGRRRGRSRGRRGGGRAAARGHGQGDDGRPRDEPDGDGRSGSIEHGSLLRPLLRADALRAYRGAPERPA